MKILALSLKTSALLWCALGLAQVAFAAPDPAQKAFEAGNTFLEKRQYAKAVQQFQIVLKAQPDEPSSLWNGGTAAYFIGDYKTASTWFARLQKQEPSNGHLLAKRLQCAQELGDLKTRDLLRTKLLALHKSGKDSTGYLAKNSYCRDQFLVGKDEVFAFEYFVLRPRSNDKDALSLGRRFDFYVSTPDDKQKLLIECGWSALDKTANGQYVPSRELPAFYYDAYYPSGPWERRTFGLGPVEPSFEDVKKQVVAIIQGKAQPVSGSPRG